MPADTAYVSVRLDNNTTGNVVYFSNLQLEKKDHATPFVHGSRTGDIHDVSGYNNTGTQKGDGLYITTDAAIGSTALACVGSCTDAIYITGFPQLTKTLTYAC